MGGTKEGGPAHDAQSPLLAACPRSGGQLTRALARLLLATTLAAPPASVSVGGWPHSGLVPALSVTDHMPGGLAN